ncbi:MAG TPA: CAP domain-containing protein [Vicinamibacterales bacterium]|nr:CAP domain-containing protein [Vicinamibacterales bacterium]
MRHRPAVAAAICAAALCSTPAPSIARPDARAAAASSVTGDVIDLTNVERTRQHRSALHANARLMRAAQIQAEQMARAHRLAHVLPNATYPSAQDRLAAANYRWRTYGENVALGQPDARDVVRSWMHSRGHRTNILNADFSEIGAGYATDTAGRPYYVQVFGRPLS